MPGALGRGRTGEFGAGPQDASRHPAPPPPVARHAGPGTAPGRSAPGPALHHAEPGAASSRIAASPAPRLWLRLVGGFTVYRDGRIWPGTAVGSRKARTLLALLAVQRHRLVPIDHMIEVLWGDTPPRRPADNVATMVSRLRSRLGADVVVGDRNGYRLGGTPGVDLYDAAALVAAAEAHLAGGDPGSALWCARHALALLDDAVVLADQPGAAWAEPAHALHAESLRRARHAVADAALRTGDTPAAAAAAETAVYADPLDEAAYRLLMKAHDSAGEPARALLVYERLRTTLAHELGVHPATPTRDLHTTILRHNSSTHRADARERADATAQNPK